MSAKPNPSYYAIITADVRYNDNLTSTAKLLFGEITALSNTQGFCSASNGYFAKLYGITTRRISELVTSLAEAGCVTVEVDQAGGNKRKIRIATEINTDTYGNKVPKPYGNKVPHNNTSINISSNKHMLDQRLAVYTLYLKCFKLNKHSFITVSADEVKDVDLNYLMDKAAKRYKLTPKREALIDRRIKDAGYNMVCAAIVGYSKDDFYTGGGNRSWTADLEFICRSYENVEKGVALYEQSKSGKIQGDDWENLR